MAKRIGLVLSGCGVYDGAEIHEAVFSMWHLAKHGYEVVCLAPNRNQAHVFDHLAGGEAQGEERNVLVESARIARGDIKDIARVSAAEFDGLFFPGGFGAAKNLCTYAFDGADAKVDPGVEKLIREMHEAKKPLGFVCIAPACAAKVLGNGVELTIGTDEGTAADIEKMGAKHLNKMVEEAHVDRANRVVSAAAYMSAQNILEVEKSVHAAVEAFADLVGPATANS